MFRFGFIGDGLRYLLDAIYGFVPNYGWAIILFTVLIRLILMPLDIKSKRSMKRMSDVQPQINALNKKYAKDKEKLNQKMSELYRKEKINPLSGCLPMLIQMPILFAMFAVMREVADEKTIQMILNIKANISEGNLDYRPVLESVLWIKNVFQPDSFMSTVFPAAVQSAEHALAGINYNAQTQATLFNGLQEARTFLASPLYAEWAAAAGNTLWKEFPIFMSFKMAIPMYVNGWFILPILAAASQFLSTKLMPGATPQADPNGKAANSQLMKYFFPLFSLWICSTSNAGFALYWVAINIIQILQQVGINKWIDYSDAKKKLKEAPNS